MAAPLPAVTPRSQKIPVGGKGLGNVLIQSPPLPSLAPQPGFAPRALVGQIPWSSMSHLGSHTLTARPVLNEPSGNKSQPQPPNASHRKPSLAPLSAATANIPQGSDQRCQGHNTGRKATLPTFLSLWEGSAANTQPACCQKDGAQHPRLWLKSGNSHDLGSKSPTHSFYIVSGLCAQTGVKCTSLGKEIQALC